MRLDRTAALCVLLFSLLACSSTQSWLTRSVLRRSPDPGRSAHVAAVKARARALGLAGEDQWLRLGHWRSKLLGGFHSQADGENFFLSPDGSDDPERELDATIDGFFAELAPYDSSRSESKGIQHPICQFPARFRWLNERLGFDAKWLPTPDCPRFRTFHDALQAESVTMVFSAYYLNNPASAFGHTFLRLNKRNDMVSEERRRLLDYGIEFSADPDTTFAPLYAIKGIAGAFPGTFRRLPYYFKVRQYNDYESRDLWEYKLALTPAQIEMLIAHAWELGSTFFDYFYLSENCSYHLLGLIEVAAERNLLDHLRWPVIPADAIKTLFAHSGFVTDIKYRPSARTKFRYQLQGLTDVQQEAIEQLVEQPTTPLAFNDQHKIEVIDAAQDLIDIRFAKELVQQERAGIAVQRKQALLERRAEILVPSPEITPRVPWVKMPQLGHDSHRLMLGVGADQNDGRWIALGTRLAMHDLADPTDGFPELAQLEFLPLRARYDYSRDDFRLDQLDLVHVLSLTRLNRFDHHRSWEFRIGSQRLMNEGCDCYAFHVQVGRGFAVGSSSERVTFYAMAQAHAWSGPELDGLFGAPIRVGIGPGGGLRVKLTPNLVSLVVGEWLWLPRQSGFDTWNVTATMRWLVSQPIALDVELKDENETASGVVSTVVYF